MQARGFAAISRERNREISRQGGLVAHWRGTAHEFTSGEQAREAGRKGGQKVAQDRAHMAAIGRKGGQKISQDREHMAAIGRKGGASISQDRGHMAAIGKIGGST